MNLWDDYYEYVYFLFCTSIFAMPIIIPTRIHREELIYVGQPNNFSSSKLQDPLYVFLFSSVSMCRPFKFILFRSFWSRERDFILYFHVEHWKICYLQCDQKKFQTGFLGSEFTKHNMQSCLNVFFFLHQIIIFGFSFVFWQVISFTFCAWLLPHAKGGFAGLMCVALF